MNRSLKHRIAAPALLFFLSPIVAELLFGSTPLSRIVYLVPQLFFYGSGALLVRETARRFRLGWFSVVMLGIAFGVIEEALALQTVFNPDYFGLDISYGRRWGVNWVWSFFIIGYHALWSITLSIMLSELVFPKRARQVWLNKAGYGVFGGIYLFMTVSFYFIFQEQSGFTAPIRSYLFAAGIALALIVGAFFIPSPATKEGSPVSPLRIGVITLFSASIWLGLFSLSFGEDPIIPAGMLLAVGALTAVLYGWIISRQSERGWSKLHRFSVVAAGLLISMLFGLNVLLEVGHRPDIIAHIFFVTLTIILLTLLGKSIHD